MINVTDILRDQVAIVTGASRGIGRSLALALAERGMRVGLLARTHVVLDETLRACAKAGGRAVAVPADVTRPDAVHAAVETVERDLGPIDLLVNNAGRVDSREALPWEADTSDWWQVVEANLRGPFLLCHAVLPGMVRRGHGRVVTLNSSMAARPVPLYSAYSVSKSAALRLSDALAEPLGERGVSIFDVSPGTVRTDMTLSMGMWDDMPEDRWTPVDRVISVVAAIAEGRLDELTGRFIHAGKDDLGELIGRAEEIRKADARTMRLRPYGGDDPLAGP